jgi:hypothetical protein
MGGTPTPRSFVRLRGQLSGSSEELGYRPMDELTPSRAPVRQPL